MSLASKTNSELVTRIKNEADRCVACGLCLPHCPTYRETRTENESPRGRIALMRALVRGELPLTPQLESHLDLCLSCRNCERVCPANVQYGRLIDNARNFVETNRGRPLSERLLRGLTMDRLIARPLNLRLLAKTLRLYQRSGLQRLVRASRVLRLFGLDRWDRYLPPIPAQSRWQQSYAAQGSRQGRIALFTGCVTDVVDRSTLEAAVHVLNRLGHDVHVPIQQVCCGALHQHGGETEMATALMRRNVAAFNTSQVDAIISTASGCGATLAEYGDYSPNDDQAHIFSARVRDVSRFVSDCVWPTNTELAPLAKRVAVHSPCTLINVLHDENYAYSLLERIPDIDVYPLPENNLCCGAAGIYFLTQPTMAVRLRTNKLEALKQSPPDIVATSNIGCALHLAAGIRDAGLDIEVVHPVVLLERQLRLIDPPPRSDKAGGWRSVPTHGETDK